MIKKDGGTSSKGYATWSYRQLNKVDSLIEKLEKSNFVKKFFNRECLILLKEQKKFIKRSIEKEIELGTIKEESKFHKGVNNIVKENRRLEKEILRSGEVNYISKRELNHGNQKRGRGKPKKVLSLN